MSKTKPVIDESGFKGADVGIILPARQNSVGGFGLQIDNLDRTDPPNYAPNGVPRSPSFNKNVFKIDNLPTMPKIPVVCKTTGFAPSAASPLLWRLQTLHVLGRFTRKGPPKHYVSKVVKLAGAWTGTATASSFTLFDPKSAPVAYDNLTDRTCGGHAILTVAYPVAATGQWLLDFVHLRIGGTNPKEKDIRDEVKQMVSGRNAPPFEYMLDAIFAWEASFRQFAASKQTKAKYEGVQFDWPDDPPDYPVASFDFGIGLAQYTSPSTLVTPIAWDWRQNLHSGANVFFDKLRQTYKSKIRWDHWALAAWERYNGTGAGAVAYAQRLAGSPDGKLVPSAQVPANFDLDAALEPFAFPIAPPEKWPIGPKIAEEIARSQLNAVADLHAAEAIASATASIARNRPALAWLWPLVERDLHGRREHAATFVLPGVAAADLSKALAGKGRPAVSAFADLAFDLAWHRLGAKPARPAFARASSISAEWKKLIPFVRDNIGNGKLADYAAIRDLLLAYFGAPKDPDLAIKRINAYYGAFVSANFLPKGNSMMLHADMKARLDQTTKLLAAKGVQPQLEKVGSIGGFNIRRNANNHKVLSNHSFGVACDLDPPLNPNLPFKKAEWRQWDQLVGFLTGVYPYGDESDRLRTPRKYDASLSDVQALCQASLDCVTTNLNLTNLANAVVSGIQRRSGISISVGDARKLLVSAAPPHPDKPALNKALIDNGMTSKLAGQISDILIYGRNVFELSHTPGLKPEISGNAATAAKFGFINLPAEVITALTASDGGALRWLGTSNATKDYMHFDFRDDERPKPF